jgi:hypothetical protein
MLALLRRKLPFEHDDVIKLAEWSMRQGGSYGAGWPQVVNIVENYLQDHALTPTLEEKIRQLVIAFNNERSRVEVRQWIGRLNELIGVSDDSSLPLVPQDAWASTAIRDIRAMDNEQESAWLALLNICLRAGGSAPTNKWLREAQPPLETIGFPAFKQAVLKWFPLADTPLAPPIMGPYGWQPNPNQYFQDVNADILKGLVWLCAGREDKEIARALTALTISTYRQVPGGGGRRSLRVGNACVWALGNMPGTEGIAQLALLKAKLKFVKAQKVIESALESAAQRVGMSPSEIEELSVPTYGLDEVGIRRETLGEFTAELVVVGSTSTELRWTKPDGKQQASVPRAVKQRHKDELKELKQAAEDVRKMLPAQRDRIENLYLEQKVWPFAAWRERYLDHPLVGVIARRLIWKFTRGDQAASGVWLDGQIVGRDGKPLTWLDDATQVELWHPLQVHTDVVLAWRDFLAEHEIRQPFKQAHREIYVLTDAERTTRVYSNRFAAHILKQHQFNALCAARGWKNKLRLMVDDELPPATRLLPAWNLRAEFWIEDIGDNYGVDTNETGTYLYLTTDQVRFYAIGAATNYSHAGALGYHAGGYAGGRPWDPLPLEEVPPLVFSEIMRDVDLFVGVASVANDPNWSDGGPEGRYRDYWADRAFGDLSATAQTRKQVLERLVPRLKIADRTHLKDRFLVVRGDLRTYKIHLGSGNILMEPNDQYLCIVPARGAATEGVTGNVFLPFEGDNMLAIILSKAFLLAADKDIKDPTITRQIRR